MNGVPTVAVAELPADALLLDVREADEWAAGHAPTARHLPMSELVGADRRAARRRPAVRRLPLRRPVGPGGGLPRRQGYPAVNVDGGMQAWSAQGRDRRRRRRRAADHLSRPRGRPPAGMPCPRCGHCSDAAGGPFCPHCGRYLAPLQWVAEPPPSIVAAAADAACRPATSGRRATAEPAVGLPARRRGAADGPARARPDPADAPARWPRSRCRCCGRRRRSRCWPRAPRRGATTLLLASRDGALSADAVAASDALVLAAGTGTVLLGLVAGGFAGRVDAAAAAAPRRRAAGRGRRGRGGTLVLGWLVPGLNLVGARVRSLAEIEHGALDRPPDRRPRPSRLVRRLVAAVGGGVCSRPLVLAWSLRTGVQARADGVVLHAVLDLLAAVTAGVTAVLVSRLTRAARPGPGAAPAGCSPCQEPCRRVRKSPAAPAAPA